MEKSKERPEIRMNQGITLIALVITIIVLLILAGVSLSLIAGSDGILEKATSAVDKYKDASNKEQEEFKQVESRINQYLPKEIPANSLVKQVKAENYGDSVNYSVEVNGVTLDDWKIFYNDGNTVTLIYGSYLPNATKLAKEAGLVLTGDYVVNAPNNRKELIDVVTMPENWASLLKGNVDLSNRAKANGAPSLQSWVESWNEKGYTHLEVKQKEIAGDGLMEYFVKTEEEESVDLSLKHDSNGFADKLYFPYQIELAGCEGYWVSTAAWTSTSWAFAFFCNGYLRATPQHTGDGGSVTFDYYSIVGIRPTINLSAWVLGEKIDDVWNIE